MTLQTRKPTGKPPWPILLLAGAEKPTMRKSALAVLDTGSERLVLPLRFIEKVEFTEACWLWTGANSGGISPYGVTWDGDRRVKAHRFAYEATGASIPARLTIDHLCKQTLCVRPSHLEAVTKAENVMRSDAPGPLAVRSNHCKRGHEFTPENTKQRGPRHRECRSCIQIHRTARNAERTALRNAARKARAA